MEINSLQRASNSIVRNVSAAWRNSNGLEVFSGSSREENDEEALKWAALEKLPTYDRLRKGILLGSRGDHSEIDVTDLGFEERKKLLDRLVNAAEDDNKRFLMKLKDRIDRVGIELPTIEVRFENLNVETEAHVGSRALPSFINFFANMFEGFANYLHILPSNKKQLLILQNVSGILKPSRMTLLLGPPGSGKTTFFLALAGMLDPSLKFSGTVTYNGHSMKEFVPQRTAAYISQHDVHLGEMTVRETLAFSARCQGVGSSHEMLAELSRREKEANIKPDPDVDIYMKAAAIEGQEASVVTDYILKVLGLDICADTVVGSDMIRGISGGQRKRVTTVEIAVLVALTYYEIGYDPNIWRFLKYYLLLLVEIQTASSLFRLIGVVGRNMIIANTYGFFVLLLMFALSGFVLARESVKKWWIWGYYISPMMYADNAILVNEFRGHSWSQVPANSNVSLGVQVLNGLGFFPDSYWYWIGAGALAGWMLLYSFCSILALTWLNPLGKSQAVLPANSAENESERSILTETNNREDRRTKRDVILPFEPHSIAFDEVTYSVDMPQEMKEQGANGERLVLLHGVSGVFRPGVLTALMGVSGAGKTTLMDVLAGRKTGGYIEGRIMISGYPKKQETFARISGYCEQNDIHSPCVTVYESLLFSAWLRLPSDVDSETRKMFIENVMELVELTQLREGLVGLPGVNGLSTEQRKRLTIAVELVANPSIIFMDEPTSGLDARAAAIVMRTVRNTVDTGRTVLCTIHQPSIDIFEAFDELFLMKRGGREIYVGPLGRHSCHLIHYFEKIPGVKKIRDGYNPATWMLEVTASSQEMILGVDFTELYKNTEHFRRNKALINELSTPHPGSQELHFPTQYSQPFFTQCIACLWKQHWSYWRNPLYSAVRLVYSTFLALIFGSMFWDLGSKRGTEQNIFNAMGSMYASVFFLGVQIASSVQPVVSVERTVFYREKAAGLYSALPYAFSQALIEVPYGLIQATIYGTIVYTMIGFEWTAAKFFWYIFFMCFTILYFTFYGMMAVAMTPNVNIANIVSYAFYSFWNLFSGFIISRPRTPVWWRWYHWANPVAWSLYGLVASQFGDVEDQLDTKQSVQDFVRDYFGFRHDLLGLAAGVIVGFVVVFAFVFAYCVKALNFQRR